MRIRRYPSPRRLVALNTYLHYFAPGILTIRSTCVLHSSQGLQLCCSCLHNAWRCLCLSSADSHILPLRYCCVSDAALTPYMFRFEILSNIAIQSSLRIHCLPLHLLRNYCILQVWNVQTTLHTLSYYALSPPHSALINHRLAMLIPPHPHPHHRPARFRTLQHPWFPGQTYYALSPPHSALIHHRLAMLIPPHLHPHHRPARTHTRQHHWVPGQTYYALSPPHSALIHHWLAMVVPPYPHPHRVHPRPHTCRHDWFPGTSRVQSRAFVTGWQWEWHHLRCFHHLHLGNARCPLASRNEVHHPCTWCLSRCLD